MEEIDQLTKAIVEKGGAACPHCHEPLSIDLVAKASAESRMWMGYKPASGELMDVESICVSLRAAAKLLKEVSKNLGTKAEVMLGKIETTADGEQRFELVIARVPKP